MFRALRRNAVLSVGSKRWFSSTSVCKLLACQGAVAGTATQDMFKPLSGKIQVEYAKSSRSSCAMCGFPIAENSLRIGTFQQGTGDFFFAAWQHPRCFRSMTLQLYPDIVRYTDDGIALKRLSSIKPGDRDLIAQILTDDDSCTWRSLLGTVITSSEIEMIDQQLAASTLAREALAKWKDKDLMTLSNANISPQAQMLAGDDSKVLTEWEDEELEILSNANISPDYEVKLKAFDRDLLTNKVSSLLLFGPIAPCEVCSSGELVPDQALGTFRCIGRFAGSTRCGTIVAATDIRRTTLKVPSTLDHVVEDARRKIAKESPFDKQIIVGHVVKLAAAKWREQHGRSLGDAANVKTYRDLTFFTNKNSLQDKSIDWGAVTAHGGVVTEKREPVQGEFNQDGSEHYVKTTKSDSKSSSIDRSLPIVSTEWIQESTKVLRPLTAIEGFTYYEDDRRRPSANLRWTQSLTATSNPPSTNATTESAISTVVFSGSAPVDEESNLAATHSVYHTNDLPWSATLSFVDLSPVVDKNSFYILQLLRANGKRKYNPENPEKKYVVFRRWGRLGDPIYPPKMKEFLKAEEAESEFEKYFQDKTGNEWQPLTADRGKFEEKPGKYNWVDRHLADGDEDTLR